MKYKTLLPAILPQYLSYPANPTTHLPPSKQAAPRSKATKIPAKTAIHQAASLFKPFGHKIRANITALNAPQGPVSSTKGGSQMNTTLEISKPDTSGSHKERQPV